MSSFNLERSEAAPGNKRSTQQSVVAQDVTEALGHVPIVRLNRISKVCETHELYLKLESCNPGGSIKEKNAAFLIKDAEESGLLKPGGTIIESSSGNFGIGLAMVGAARGYRVMIVIDAKTPPPMRRMLLAYGAELVDVPLTEADSGGSMQVARMKKAESLASRISGGWYPCQHKNPKNPAAHALWTAQEIEKAFDTAPDAIVIGVSTAGQIAGIGRYFKDRFPEMDIVGVDVAGSAVFGMPRHPYKMTGLGLSFVPPNFDPSALAEAYNVDDQLAFSVCHLLAKREGLLLGASTGAIVAAALAYAEHHPARKKIVMVNPDRGDRYLETIYEPRWLEEHGISILSHAETLGAIKHLEAVPKATLLGGMPHER